MLPTLKKVPPYLLVMLFAFGYRVPAQLYTKGMHITEAEGLSDNRVTCVYKGSRDYVWVGTRNGLNRYDGIRMKVYRPGNGNGLSGENVQDVAEDSARNIWVATTNGLNRLDAVTGRWQHFLPAASTSTADIPSNLIWDLLYDSQHRLWVVSDVHQLSWMDTRTHQFTYYDWPAFASAEPAFKDSRYRSIKRMVQKSGQEFYLATNMGLVLFNAVTARFTLLATYAKSEILGLAYDADAGNVYVSTEGNGVLQYNEFQAKPRWLSISSMATAAPVFAPAIGTQQYLPHTAGMLGISGDRAFFHQAHSSPLADLPPMKTTVTYADPDGLLWVGSNEGLTIFDRSNPNEYFLPLQATAPGQQDNRMTGLCYDAAAGTYWAATSLGGVFEVNTVNKAIRRYLTDASGRPLGSCFKTFADSKGHVWLLSEHRVFRKKPGHEAFSGENKGLPTGSHSLYRAVAEDAEGRIWLGAFNGGITVLPEGAGPLPEEVLHELSTIKVITDLAFDSAGNTMWISTYSSGVHAIDLRHGKHQVYAESAEHPAYSALHLSHDVATGSKGKVAVATDAGGVFTLGEVDRSFQQLNMSRGLLYNQYFSLAYNRQYEVLYALGARGISAIDASGSLQHVPGGKGYFNFRNYASDVREPHDLVYNEVRNELAVGVAGGLLLHRLLQPGALPVPKLAITEVLVNEQPYQTGTSNGVALFRFPSDSNSLALSLAPFYYGARQDYQLQVMLAGFDKKWKNAGADWKQEYPRLPAGEYRFHARLVTPAGYVLVESSALRFKIDKAFYNTAWFAALLLALVAALIFFLFRWRVEAVRRKAKLRQDITELEARALRAQMNPHFIFNALNAIQELVLTNRNDEAYEYLSQFSRLLRMVLHHSDANTILLSEELEMAHLYLALESLRFRDHFTYGIHVEESIEQDNVEMPGFLLQPYMENALVHGLRHKKGERHLEVTIRRRDGQLVINIADNGIGRTAAAGIKADRIAYAAFESKGTLLSRHRLDALARHWRARTDISTQDITDSDGSPAGTVVTISLPFLTRH